jgi:hypothetical protein
MNGLAGFRRATTVALTIVIEVDMARSIFFISRSNLSNTAATPQKAGIWFEKAT